MKVAINKSIRDEKGQALILVLILMVVGGLIIAPLLSYMSTGLIAGRVYEEKADEFYAADAGVEDALWQIKYDQLTNLFGAGYDPYNYGDPYPYPDLLEVNDKDVGVTIENIWVPQMSPAPDPDEAELIIEGDKEADPPKPPKLIIVGGIPGESEYQIKIFYYYEQDDTEPDYDPGGANLKVETIGIWLPPGFDYVGNCSLADDDDTAPYSVPDVDNYCSGKAVVWDFGSVPQLKAFPGDTGYPMVRSFTFDFSGPAEQSPGVALSWITTTGVTGIDYTWDADVKVYHITSQAGGEDGTTVDAYTARSEMRELGTAMSGDYCAVGGTLMTATGDEKYRDQLFMQSSAAVQSSDPEALGYIPPGATTTVDAAFLYWSGWIEEADMEIVFADPCTSFDNWQNGSSWSISGFFNKEFRGLGGGSGSANLLTLNPGVVLLGEYHDLGKVVNISWEQDASWRVDPTDCLQFQFFNEDDGWGELIPAFCGNNPSSTFSYIIPDEYVTDSFKMAFLLDFDASNKYAYIDNIRISVAEPLVESAKVNRVIFSGDEYGSNPITVTNPGDCQVEPTPDSGAPDSWSYSCFKDVTDIVRAELAGDMSGTFTLGHWTEGNEYDLYPSGSTDYPLATPASCTGWGCDRYQWTYAGWSLLIIYSSPETKGHQLYLFPTFHYVGAGGQPTTLEFPISGFLAPDDTTGSHLTYFVGEGDAHYTGDSIEINGSPLSDPPGNPWNNIFNSYSNTISETTVQSGIDIDTFDMSEYIEPDSTSADVVLITIRGADGVAEIYNLVYIILSFRSDVTSGGTITYLIRG